MSRSLLRGGSLSVLVVLAFSAAPAPAQTTYTWTGGDSSDDGWFSPLNWSAAGPGSPPPLNNLTSTFVVLSGNTQTTNTLDYSFSANSLTFDAAAGAFTVGTTTSETLTLGMGGLTVASGNTHNQTFNANLALGAAGTWANNGSGTLAVGGTVDNGGFLLTVGGTGNSTYSGVISGAGGLAKTGAGTVTLGGVNTFTGPVVITGGVLQIGSASQVLPTGTATVTLDGGTLRNTNAVNGNPFLSTTHLIVIGAGGGTLDVPSSIVLTYTGNATTPGGSISGTGTITKTGPGTLRLSNTGVVPAVHSVVTVPKLIVAGGLWQGGSDTVFGAVPSSYLADAITLDGGGISANASFSITANRGITVGSAGGVLNSSSQLNISSKIVGSGGITKTGANNNAVILTGLTSYTGPTVVSAGILRAGAANAFSAASAFTLTNTNGAGGSSIDLNGFSQSIGSLAGGGSLGGNVSLGSASLTTGGDGTSTTFAGIINGTGGFTKSGAGTQTFTGINTYTGSTTINGGTLAIGTGGSLAAGSAVAVNNTGTLAGTGTVNGSVSVASGGTIRGGDGTGSGTLTLGNGLALAASANLGVRLSDASQPSALPGGSTLGTIPNPTSNNFLNITAGGLTANFATIQIVVEGTGAAFDPNLSYSYQIGAVMGQDLSTLTVSDPAQFTTIGFADAFNFSLTGNSSGAVFLNLAPVPEPAAILALAAGSLSLGGLIRGGRGRRPTGRLELVR